jgi:hypothetical protein
LTRNQLALAEKIGETGKYLTECLSPGLQRDRLALYQQVEKELETGLTAGNIRIFHFSAGVAQLVEHFLAKEDVASSSLVTRFSFPPRETA